eukprot:gene34755-24225_t
MVDATEEERAQIDELKLRYVNAVNAVAFHGEQLADLVDALWAARREYTKVRSPAARLVVENAKLDVQERKDKRYWKVKEKDEVGSSLRAIINTLQLRALADGRNPA